MVVAARLWVIHAMHVDSRKPRPDGQDRRQDQALPERSDRRGVVRHRAVAAVPGAEGTQAGDRSARGPERNPLHGPLGLRVADAADPFRALADGLLVVPTLRAAAAVPHHSRRGGDDQPRARRTRGKPVGRHHRQPRGRRRRRPARAVTMRPRRRSAGSVTSRSTPTAGC